MRGEKFQITNSTRLKGCQNVSQSNIYFLLCHQSILQYHLNLSCHQAKVETFCYYKWIGRQNIILLCVKPIVRAAWYTVMRVHAGKMSVWRVKQVYEPTLYELACVHTPGMYAEPHAQTVWRIVKWYSV